METENLALTNQITELQQQIGEKSRKYKELKDKTRQVLEDDKVHFSLFYYFV